MVDVLAVEVMDMGENQEVDEEFFQSVCDLFDMYQFEFASDNQLDYSAVTQEEVAVPSPI